MSTPTAARPGGDDRHARGRTPGAAIRVNADNTDTIVHISGRLDSRSVADVRAPLHEAIEAAGERNRAAVVQLDLSAVEVGDTTGLGFLMHAHSRARRAGVLLYLVDASPRTVRLLRRAHLDRFLHPSPAVAAAACLSS